MGKRVNEEYSPGSKYVRKSTQPINNILLNIYLNMYYLYNIIFIYLSG